MKDKRIAVIDLETDPFHAFKKVMPFACGFFDGATYWDYWGDDCIDVLMKYLKEYKEPLLIYGHNAGKFDYLFMLKYMTDQKPKVINGRIVQWFYEGHELRDSYSILPVPLRQSGNKKEIDYNKMERGVRWRHRKEIMNYLYHDCISLHEMVIQFRDNLGSGLTMAGVSTKLLKSLTAQPVDRLTLEQDADIRQFFFGGRVECFEKGIVYRNIKLWDVRSMYPDAMKRFKHPASNTWTEHKDFDDETDFIQIDATSYGAFPLRTKTGLKFPYGRHTFAVTGHELRAALDCRLVIVHRVIRSVKFTERVSFGNFVDTYTELRRKATESGDAVGKLHYKLVQNSSYGRFALNPDKLYDWMITKPNELWPWEYGWHIASEGEHAIFWKKAVSDEKKQKAISNVATGASITGAARSRMLYAIAGAEQKIYCDTDSIIGRNLNVPPDDGNLGSWQLEAEGNKIAVAGKKLYALFGEQANDNETAIKRLKQFGDPSCIKLASKGVKLTAPEIVRVCCGDVINWSNDAPTMGMDGSQSWITRRIRMT